ncbi:class I SAM-dependent methyltransferase [Embleya sp. NPDC127516]|uniref:class I SAM-dependent methyltransferase n=1 Tax=Embleya sp. NPDC127516 TaxID=3363990 RepID=UPI003812DC21
MEVMTATAEEEVIRFERSVATPDLRMSGYASMVPEYYRLVGDIYREMWGPSGHFSFYRPGQDREAATEATERFVADQAGITSGMRVLDVCSGGGGPALTIAAYTGAHVTGVDLVPGRVRDAREAAGSRGLTELVSFVVGDVMTLPFPDHSFDAAFSFDALTHVPDPLRVHREVARVLKPGAAWTGTDWFQSERPSEQAVLDIIEPICQTHGLSRMCRLTEYEHNLPAAGFTDVRVCDGRQLGDWEPNWALLEELVAAAPLESLPPVHRMMARGARALCEGARSGDFLVGHWRARMPKHGSAAR